MINPQIVGAIVKGDLTDFNLQAADAKTLAQHGVAADTLRIVNNYRTTDVAALQILTRATRRATVRSMTQVMAANSATRMLESANIPSLVYKGVALASQTLGDWRGRDSADVDVLVPPEMIIEAHSTLIDNGLTRVGGDISAPGAFHRFRAFEVSYAGLPSTIDLHWNLESPGYYDVEFWDLWERRQHVRVDGLEVNAPSASDMLLISALHGTRENWRSLKQLLDFARLVTNLSPTAWQKAADLSRLGPARSLAVALAMAQLCGVSGLPANAGPWALNLANLYLEPLEVSLGEGQGPLGAVGTTPIDALKRRMLRWRVAPSKKVGADALARSILRQVGYKNRYWRFSEGNGANS